MTHWIILNPGEVVFPSLASFTERQLQEEVLADRMDWPEYERRIDRLVREHPERLICNEPKNARSDWLLPTNIAAPYAGVGGLPPVPIGPDPGETEGGLLSHHEILQEIEEADEYELR